MECLSAAYDLTVLLSLQTNIGDTTESEGTFLSLWVIKLNICEFHKENTKCTPIGIENSKTSIKIREIEDSNYT